MFAPHRNDHPHPSVQGGIVLFSLGKPLAFRVVLPVKTKARKRKAKRRAGGFHRENRYASLWKTRGAIRIIVNAHLHLAQFITPVHGVFPSKGSL